MGVAGQDGKGNRRRFVPAVAGAPAGALWLLALSHPSGSKDVGEGLTAANYPAGSTPASSTTLFWTPFLSPLHGAWSHFPTSRKGVRCGCSSVVELHQLLCTFSASCIKARLTARWFTSGREGTSETLGALGE